MFVLKIIVFWDMISRRFVVIPTFPSRVSTPSSEVSKNNKLRADPKHQIKGRRSVLCKSTSLFSSATPMNEIHCWARNRKPYNEDGTYDNGIRFLVDGLDGILGDFCKRQCDWRERVEMGRWFVLGFDPRVALSRRLKALARWREVTFLILVFSTAEERDGNFRQSSRKFRVTFCSVNLAAF